MREAYLNAVVSHQNFNLQVKLCNQANGVLQLQFRSANSSTIGSSMPRIAVPAMIETKESKEGESTYYYVQIISSTATSRRSLQTSSRHSMDSSPRNSSASFSKSSVRLFSLVNDDEAAFGDVKLGLMLGHGSFGYVYRGGRYSASACTVLCM